MSGQSDSTVTLFAKLDALGIAHKTYDHPPVFTVQEAAQLYESQPGGHTKNLFLKDRKDGLWLVVCRDDLAVDLKALSDILGAPRFSFGSSELLVETLGVTPGSVTPFAIINDAANTVRVVLDEGMFAFEVLNFHPLRNDRTTAIAANDLPKFLTACGHAPLIVTIPARA
ncbi:MAG TPA: prolyl-tRNA synthetase associated domain-containing protein [Rhizomicrobium sp.]|jgi:Ala-tRNA(Pro) deacylase